MNSDHTASVGEYDNDAATLWRVCSTGATRDLKRTFDQLCECPDVQNPLA
ncbi:MAG: hypothetical protein ACJAXA_002682 [Candidatus Aldehydirespiratoraceae bacterium]|jgi:hypothetical protein